MTQFTLSTLTLEQLIALVTAVVMTYLRPNVGPNGVRLCCKSIQCNSENLHGLLQKTEQTVSFTQKRLICTCYKNKEEVNIFCTILYLACKKTII